MNYCLDLKSDEELQALSEAIAAEQKRRTDIIAQDTTLDIDARWEAYIKSPHTDFPSILHITLSNDISLFGNEYDSNGIVDCYRHQPVDLDDINNGLCDLMDGLTTYLEPDDLSDEAIIKWRLNLCHEIQTLLMNMDFGTMEYDW